MTDRQLKIKIVVRGQGTSISDGAASALGASSENFSHKINNLLQGLRIDRIAAAAATVTFAIVAGWWWMSAGDAEADHPVLITESKTTLLSGFEQATSPPSGDSDKLSAAPGTSTSDQRGSPSRASPAIRAGIPKRDQSPLSDAPTVATSIGKQPGHTAMAPTLASDKSESRNRGESEQYAALLARHGSAALGVQTTAEFAQLSVVMSDAGPTESEISEENAALGQSRNSSVNSDQPHDSKRLASERDPFVEYLRRRGTRKEASLTVSDATQAPSSLLGETVVNAELTTEAGHVRRSQLTSGVRNKEPIDALVRDVTVAKGAPDRVYFFTELRDLAGQRVAHKWMHGDKVMATVRFNIRGDRWRVYSSKLVTAAMTGQWRVRMEDAEGNLLSKQEFLVTNP